LFSGKVNFVGKSSDGCLVTNATDTINPLIIITLLFIRLEFHGKEGKREKKKRRERKWKENYLEEEEGFRGEIL
jgi:hypothetical protein